MTDHKSIGPIQPVHSPAGANFIRPELPNNPTLSASSPGQGSKRFNLKEELLAVAKEVDSLNAAINAARARLDALGSSLDAVEEAHAQIGHNLGALAYVISLI
jgi:hypothetical protein